MVDLCYQDFDLAELTKAFGIKKGDPEQLAKLSELANSLFEKGTINWRILSDGSIFKRSVVREAYKPEAVIQEMIDFVQHTEKMY